MTTSSKKKISLSVNGKLAAKYTKRILNEEDSFPRCSRRLKSELESKKT